MTLKSNVSRYGLMAIEAVAFLCLLIWIGRTAIAVYFARKATLEGFQHAVSVDPSNADYQLQLGRIYEYEPSAIDSDKALTYLAQTVRLDPYNPQAWLDLGAALEFQGKTSEAEACLRRADLLAPHLPAYQYAIGNYFLLHGNISEAFRHFKVVLTGTPRYNPTLFELAWKASGDPQAILQQLIPEVPGQELAYISYLGKHQHLAEAHDVWQRVVQDPRPFPPLWGAEYIDQLILADQPTEAYRVWTDLVDKGLIRTTMRESDENLVINGNFEDEMLNMGFDWRFVGVAGVYAGLDPTTYHSPGHSMVVEFSGKDNTNYWHAMEFVVVEPNHPYELQGFMKTEQITTDSGPRLQVYDYYDSKALFKISESLTGTTMGWIPITIDFRTGPKTKLIVVCLRRFPSSKLDNLIKGKVWIDDITLRNASPPMAKGEKRAAAGGQEP